MAGLWPGFGSYTRGEAESSGGVPPPGNKWRNRCCFQRLSEITWLHVRASLKQRVYELNVLFRPTVLLQYYNVSAEPQNWYPWCNNTFISINVWHNTGGQHSAVHWHLKETKQSFEDNSGIMLSREDRRYKRGVKLSICVQLERVSLNRAWRAVKSRLKTQISYLSLTTM